MGQSSGLVCTECGGAGPEGSEHLDRRWGCFRGRGHLDSGGHTTEGFPVGKREPFGKFISINFYNKKKGGSVRSVTSGSLQSHGLSGSSVHGILQTRILEWVAISFSNDKKSIPLM